jgi:hypothetical protein
MFSFFVGTNAGMMAGVVAFVAFFCIARLMRARQGIAFAFAFTPLILIFALEAATVTI